VFDSTLALADSHGLIKSTCSGHFNLNPVILPHARYFLFLMVLVAATAMAEPTILVRAERDGGTVRLWASLQVDAAPVEVWDVLTDYQRQPRFVPSMTESRVITRNATGSVVALKGWMDLLFLHYDIDIVYSTREMRPYLLTSRVIRGNVKRMLSEYRLSSFDGGTRLDYIGEVEPEGWLAPLVGQFAIRRQVESQLQAMAHEIERRQREGNGP